MMINMLFFSFDKKLFYLSNESVNSCFGKRKICFISDSYFIENMKTIDTTSRLQQFAWRQITPSTIQLPVIFR